MATIRLPRAALLLLSLCPAASGLTQEAPRQTIFEEIEVRVIDVDVVVTDREGRPITGLKRDDFELFESGKPVEIRYFTGVSEGLRGARPGAETAVADVAPLPEEPAIPVTWIVFIDQTNMMPGHRNRALKQLQKFLAGSLAPEDRGFIAGNDGMALRVHQNLTNDRKAMTDALKEMEKSRVHPGPAMLRTSQILHDIRFVPRDDREVIYMRMIGGEIAIVMAEQAQRTRNAIRSMGALVDGMAGIEGRLALVYVGGGFDTLPASELVDAWRSRFPDAVNDNAAPDPEDHRQSIQDELDRLYANLSSTRVAVYSIYAPAPIAVSVQDPGPEVATTDRSIPGDRSRSIEASVAREMAQTTGGLCFTINERLHTQLAAVREDLSHYYSLGYIPTGPPGDRRKIQVRVKVDGARVRHRDTVSERSRPEEMFRVASAPVVHRAPVARRTEPKPPSVPVPADEANPLGIQVAAAPPQRDGFRKEHLLPFNLKLGSLAFVPHGSVHRAEFVLHFALVEPNGTLWPIESRDHALELPSSEVGAPDQNMSLVWHVELSPLRIPKEVPIRTEGMKLQVTVEDRGSHTRSVVTVPVQKPGRPYFPGQEKRSGQS
jgi:VWFA-related protein